MCGAVIKRRRSLTGGGAARSGGRDRAQRLMSGHTLDMLSLWITRVCVLHSAAAALLLPHVERYQVIRPQRLRERHRRSLGNTQVFPDELQYEFPIEGKNRTVHLEKNRGLMSSDFTQTQYSDEGRRRTHTHTHTQDHCFYHGHVVGVSDSSVSAGICSGISGLIRVRQQIYLLEPLGPTEAGDHALYRRQDLRGPHSATRGPTTNTSTRDEQDQDRDRDQDRDWDQDQDQDQEPRVSGLFRSRPWASAPEPQRFVELFVIVDHTEYQHYGSQTRSRVLGAINHVDKLYRALNIRVVLVGLEIWTQGDLIPVSQNSDATLDNFLLWRQKDLLPRERHDNAQFVTGRDLDSNTVGLAKKFTMCTSESGAINQDHHDNPLGLASTIAHEMGHNLGLSHDGAGCVCAADNNCVMAENLRTSIQAFPQFFSSCSVRQLSDFLDRAQPNCLGKPGRVKTIAVGPRCGNALLDPGEECDCGTLEECKNLCCDASTCRLTEGSHCAHGLCCENCQLRAAGAPCRKSRGECDLPEFCSGAAAPCPDDGFAMNGKTCWALAPGRCYNGSCATREHSCWRLFGPGARVAPDLCFNLNRKGEEGANCGRSQSGYTACEAPDVKCGTIFCQDGADSITGKMAAYKASNRIECKLAIDDDHTRNLDLVSTGTTCGTDKVCLNHRCVDVSVYGTEEECSRKCNNHGVCNHQGACQCDPGWAPPLCDLLYQDLPQAPAGRSGVIAGVCACALAVLLLVAALIAAKCRRKNHHHNNMDDYNRQRKADSGAGGSNPKDKPAIGAPTFLESTAAQVCEPLIVTVAPCRPAPQPPKKVPVSVTSTSQPEPFKAVGPPPVPPVKPSPPPLPRLKPSVAPPPPAKPHPHRLA